MSKKGFDAKKWGVGIAVTLGVLLMFLAVISLAAGLVGGTIEPPFISNKVLCKVTIDKTILGTVKIVGTPTCVVNKLDGFCQDFFSLIEPSTWFVTKGNVRLSTLEGDFSSEKFEVDIVGKVTQEAKICTTSKEVTVKLYGDDNQFFAGQTVEVIRQ